MSLCRVFANRVTYNPTVQALTIDEEQDLRTLIQQLYRENNSLRTDVRDLSTHCTTLEALCTTLDTRCTTLQTQLNNAQRHLAYIIIIIIH